MYNGYYGFYPGTNFGSQFMAGGMNGIRGLGNIGTGLGMGYGNFGRVGLFSGIRNAVRGINWSGILSGTQKTLNVINQIIPTVNQVKPMFNNAKTMFKIAGAMREDNKSDKTQGNRTSTSYNNNINNSVSNTNSPQFFA